MLLCQVVWFDVEYWCDQCFEEWVVGVEIDCGDYEDQVDQVELCCYLFLFFFVEDCVLVVEVVCGWKCGCNL